MATTLLFDCLKIKIVYYFFLINNFLFLGPQNIAGKTFPYRVILPSWLPYSLQLIYMGAAVLIFAIQIVSIDYLNMNLINQIRFHLKILNVTFDDLIIDAADKSLDVQKFIKIGKQRISANERLETIIEHHCLLRR